MTDRTPADRAYLCHVLRANARSLPSFQGEAMITAADEIERLEAENDWLRNALRAAQIGAGLAPTSPDDKNRNG